jgi:hypothetical protein
MSSTSTETSFLVAEVRDHAYRDGLLVSGKTLAGKVQPGMVLRDEARAQTQVIQLEFLSPRDVRLGEVTFLVERTTPSPAHPEAVLTEVPASALDLRTWGLSADPKKRLWAASNWRTPADLLAQLAEDADRGVQAWALRNPSTPPEKLVQAAGNRNLRDHVAGNRSTPGDVLAQLANDDTVMVRAHVADNQSTPAQALERLVQDPNPLVSERALTTLDQRRQELKDE